MKLARIQVKNDIQEGSFTINGERYHLAEAPQLK